MYIISFSSLYFSWIRSQRERKKEIGIVILDEAFSEFIQLLILQWMWFGLLPLLRKERESSILSVCLSSQINHERVEDFLVLYFNIVWNSCQWSSGSQIVLRGSQGIREQSPGDPRVHFCDHYFEIYFFKLKEQCFVKNNWGASSVDSMFISYDRYNI
jgi:hypothetical protein